MARSTLVAVVGASRGIGPASSRTAPHQRWDSGRLRRLEKSPASRELDGRCVGVSPGLARTGGAMEAGASNRRFHLTTRAGRG